MRERDLSPLLEASLAHVRQRRAAKGLREAFDRVVTADTACCRFRHEPIPGAVADEYRRALAHFFQVASAALGLAAEAESSTRASFIPADEEGYSR